MLKPLHDNVILKKEKAEKEVKTASGIILNDSKNVPSYARVVAIGPDSTADIKNEDKVVFKEYSGTNVTLDDEDYIIIKAEDILAVIA